MAEQEPLTCCCRSLRGSCPLQCFQSELTKGWLAHMVGRGKWSSVLKVVPLASLSPQVMPVQRLTREGWGSQAARMQEAHEGGFLQKHVRLCSLMHLRAWRGICLGCASVKLPAKWKGTALSHQAPHKHGFCTAPSWARWAPVLLPVPWGRRAPGASLLPLYWCELSSVIHRYTCMCYISVYTCVDGYICVFACWLPVL